MRKVQIPLQLNMFDMITDELREKIRPLNQEALRISKDRVDRSRQSKGYSRLSGHDTPQTASWAGETNLLQRMTDKLAQSDVDANCTALYELCGIVTHKGSTADSGHYIGWTRKDEPASHAAAGNEDWLKFDDDKVSTVPSSKISDLEGGGEDSVAYLLLYRPLIS